MVRSNAHLRMLILSFLFPAPIDMLKVYDNVIVHIRISALASSWFCLGINLIQFSQAPIGSLDHIESESQSSGKRKRTSWNDTLEECICWQRSFTWRNCQHCWWHLTNGDEVSKATVVIPTIITSVEIVDTHFSSAAIWLIGSPGYIECHR